MKKDLKSRSISITAITMACQVIDTSSILVCSLQHVIWGGSLEAGNEGSNPSPELCSCQSYGLES